MTAIVVGRYVTFDRHLGITVNDPAPDERTIFGNRVILAYAERLRLIEGWNTILDVLEKHLGAEPGEIAAAVERAWIVFDHPIIRECWHGGSGPLETYAKRSEHQWLCSVTIDEFEALAEAVAEEEARYHARREAKKQHMRIRRTEFAAQRSHLVLAMLDAGMEYVCVAPGCTVSTDLTVDHKLALSRGGTDDLSNLQFMCTRHNSQKRDGP